ncbi:MAG: polysaccharide deacetylase family protein [Bacteroidota bacterium]|nr:polysaccharide deacetylase family protein [Bacteroidota bacterium]
MLLIYSPKLTNRLKYIFRLIFRDILGSDVYFTTGAEEFEKFQGVKLSYSHSPISDEIFFYSKDILYETGIDEQNISVFDYNNYKALFATTTKSALPFDPFAASFYLVTRYEEYLPFIKDNYDRFEAADSIAFKHGFLQKPLVNIWAEEIRKIIENKYSGFKFAENKYSYIPTIDIDNAYCYIEKGFVRTSANIIKDIINLDFKKALTRTRTLLVLEHDPYDTYDKLLEIQRKYNLKPIYFFLLADYGLNDKNIDVNSEKFRSLIKKIGDYCEVGIHLSYNSNLIPEKIKTETQRLTDILLKETTASRQHFLKLRFPSTYRNLINADITDDYTMGYASECGFRASICTPFNFYDLDVETETNLKIHPFAFMDSSLKYYKNIDPIEAVEFVLPMINEVKAVKGTLITIWHNESLSGTGKWENWGNVFEEVVKVCL